jgi:hypothetical protein
MPQRGKIAKPRGKRTRAALGYGHEETKLP